MGVKLTEQAINDYVHRNNILLWVLDNGLQVAPGPWKLEGHEYQVGWLEENHPRQCYIKGAQIGATETLVLETLHGHIMNRYPQGSMYLFPTTRDVSDFSKARFDPLIQMNPFIGEYVKPVGEKGTDAQNIKKIGRGFLYLRGAKSTRNIGGAKKSSTALKSAPVDRVVFDELDEMEPKMIELAKHRVMHSEVKEFRYLGTPTIPDYGIDRMYQNSDQRVWMLECPKCGKETCLDLEFPNCIRRRLDGTAYRACIYCQAELHPSKGRWVAQYPSRSVDLVGWWISQLNSIFVDPTYILNMYENPPDGDLAEVMNSHLGRAYLPAENRLTQQEVFACCGSDAEKLNSENPTCMGVDVGRDLHVLIGERKNRQTLEIVRMTRVESFNDLHDLARRFNVKCAVLDLYPETRKVREFQKQESFQVFGCQYVETKQSVWAWDEKDRIVKVNRTELCDATHNLIAESGRLILPRRSNEVEQFAFEVCNIAKILEENTETGAREFRYRKLDPRDHYRHALNYLFLAAERTPVVSDMNTISRWINNRRRRTWMTA
jgi:phage terminase large subunit GpA-like protein